MKVPFNDLRITNDIVGSALEEVFRNTLHNSTFILGENVSSFEKEYAAFNQTKESIGVSSGLDALVLCLRALKVGPGDEVIVPSNTCFATALAVSQVDATPVFVEPKRDTFNIDPKRISDAITPNTKAIIPVHLYGQACEMSAIMKVAAQYNLFVVEDNAQAHGAQFEGRPTGSWGHISATSFYPTKNLGALGDAGIVTTDDLNLAQIVRSLRNYGSTVKNEYEHLGFNDRMDEIQAALLSVKLKHLVEWTRQRQNAAAYYVSNLNRISDLRLPTVSLNASHVYHLFVIRTDKRDELRQLLMHQGIETAIHYPKPPHLQMAYAHLGHGLGSFPIAEELATTSLSLPLFPGITEEQQSLVVNGINAFFNA